MFAILDVETTGLSPTGERMTEIAIYLHDGHKITGEYQTLINPERRIPHQITGLTGISNRMVSDQPRFCEVARKIVELTEGRIIVGHNVSFDYRFIRLTGIPGDVEVSEHNLILQFNVEDTLSRLVSGRRTKSQANSVRAGLLLRLC